MSNKSIRALYAYLIDMVDGPLPSEQIKLEEIATTLDSMFTNPEAVNAWMTDRRDDLGGMSPEDLIASRKIDQVLGLLKPWWLK